MQKTCFISIDVEHDHGSEHAKTFKGIEAMGDIIDVFRRFGISATLFVTGEVLEKHPNLVREWSSNNEIACHSYYHNFFDLMHVSDVRNELENFVIAYKKIFGTRPIGFRAPSHIIENATIRTVSDVGFSYDSSVVPHYPLFKKYRGYFGKAPKNPYYPNEIAYKKEGDMDILEIPVTGHLGGLPLAGAWIRGIPFWIYNILFRIHSPKYISFSFHSWDMLHDQKFTEKLGKILTLFERHGYNFKRGDQILNERISRNI